MISRVVDVVLEDNGHASRRDFEGNFIEASFDDTEKERETGLHFDPANVVKERKKKVKSYGAIIEEVVPGSVAAQKGNLHSGMRLIGIKTKNDKMGTWNYMMGRPFSEVKTFLIKAKRPMTLLFQDPEKLDVGKEFHEALVACDVSYGGGGHASRDRVAKGLKAKLPGQGKRGDESSSSDEDEEDDDEETKKEK